MDVTVSIWKPPGQCYGLIGSRNGDMISCPWGVSSFRWLRGIEGGKGLLLMERPIYGHLQWAGLCHTVPFLSLFSPPGQVSASKIDYS